MNQYDMLCDSALANYGLVTAKSIDALGICLKDVLEWVKSGRLEKRGRGVYRLTHHLPMEYDAFAETVADIICFCNIMIRKEYVYIVRSYHRVIKEWFRCRKCGSHLLSFDYHIDFREAFLRNSTDLCNEKIIIWSWRSILPVEMRTQ